jgi:AcrR family transcriptional regulator
MKTPKADKTRQDIVCAAERLFAEKGFRAMTLRDVTREAKVNLAAVNYYFGSKRELMLAVIRNCIEPVNVERMQRLNALVTKYNPAPIPLEHIFEALFRPLFEGAKKKRTQQRAHPRHRPRTHRASRVHAHAAQRIFC